MSVFTLSPGLILSGLYPQKKSKLNFSPLIDSSIGTHTSSVKPGKTVDSKITIFPFLRWEPTKEEALLIAFRSGLLLLSIGVGTVTIFISGSSRSASLLVNLIFLAAFISLSEHSPVTSLKPFNCLTLALGQRQQLPYFLQIQRPMAIQRNQDLQICNFDFVDII